MVIKGELPGLNEIIAAAKQLWTYVSMKQENTALVKLQVLRHKEMEKPFEIICRWYTKDLRRDTDNVAAGVKFVLDGLKDAGVIMGDSRKWVKKITHEFPEPDKGNPRVEVELKAWEE